MGNVISLVLVPIILCTVSLLVLFALREYNLTNDASARRITHPKAIKAREEAKNKSKRVYQTVSPDDLNFKNFTHVAKVRLQSAFSITSKVLQIGEKAPNVTLFRLDGTSAPLLSFQKPNRPLVINFGSYT